MTVIGSVRVERDQHSETELVAISQEMPDLALGMGESDTTTSHQVRFPIVNAKCSKEVKRTESI